MRIGSVEFEHICELELDKDSCGCVIEYEPQTRYAKAKSTPLNRYGGDKFCRFRIPWALQGTGVYLLVADGHVLYVGECENLAARFNMGYGHIQPRNCYVGGQETNCRIDKLVLVKAKEGKSVSLWFFEAPTNRKEIERKLIELARPDWNRR